MKRIILYSFLVVAACSPSKETTKAPEAKTEEKKSGMTDEENTAEKLKNTKEKDNGPIYRMVVSFFSQGAGIDEKAVYAYDNFLASYQDEYGVKLEYSKTPWGREGEVDYCFRTDQMDATQQSNFIIASREVLSGSQLVHITENAPCHTVR